MAKNNNLLNMSNPLIIMAKNNNPFLAGQAEQAAGSHDGAAASALRRPLAENFFESWQVPGSGISVAEMLSAEKFVFDREWGYERHGHDVSLGVGTAREGGRLYRIGIAAVQPRVEKAGNRLSDTASQHD